jgi:uncharacterized protein (TIGR00255 family)
MTLSSMTGYGQATVERDSVRVKVEIRTVNHRFAEFNTRLPRELLPLEEEIRARLARSIARGRTDVFVSIAEGLASQRQVQVNWELFDALCQAEQTARARVGGSEQQTPAVVQWLMFPDVLQVQPAETDLESLREVVLAAVDEACKEIVAMRRREGQRLAEDLMAKVRDLRAIVEQVAQVASSLRSELQSRLRQRVQELVAEVDEQRLLTEVALLVEKSSIDEELVRLRSHLEEFESSLREGSPVGRRLDFIVQEMHREVNTIGSKSVDVRISKAVVDAKTVVEQLREQVQNIE